MKEEMTKTDQMVWRFFLWTLALSYGGWGILVYQDVKRNGWFPGEFTWMGLADAICVLVLPLLFSIFVSAVFFSRAEKYK